MRNRTGIHWSLLVLLALGAQSCNQPKHNGKTASMWASDLSASNDYKRRLACESLGVMGPLAAEVAGDVAVMLDDVNLGVQAFCAEALGKMGSAIVPVLEPYLKATEPFVRVHAAGALIKIDATHSGAQEALINGFTGVGNADLAKMAKDLILRTGEAMVPSLVKVLENPYEDIRIESLKAIGFLAEKSREATPALIKVATTDPKWQVRKAAMKSLAAVGTLEQSTPVFRATLLEENESEEEVRDTAAMMLKLIGVRQSATGTEGADEAAQARESAAAAKPKKKSGVSIIIK